MTIDKLKQLAQGSMQMRLTRAQREERAAIRNATETARRVEVFYRVRHLVRS